MLTHLDDLESDFRVLHRIDDMYALDGPTFMRLAFRMPCYPGVMQARLRLQDQEHQACQHNLADTATVAVDLTESEVEELRNQARARANQKALMPGETPQYVPIEQLIRS